MENKLNLTPELLEKAKSATSAAALLALVQENGITLTAEEAALCFAQLHPKACALSDEELDSASGGILATINGDGTYVPVSKVPMATFDPQKGPDVALMLKNLKNAPPIDPLHLQDKEGWINHIKRR